MSGVGCIGKAELPSTSRTTTRNQRSRRSRWIDLDGTTDWYLEGEGLAAAVCGAGVALALETDLILARGVHLFFTSGQGVTHPALDCMLTARDQEVIRGRLELVLTEQNPLAH